MSGAMSSSDASALVARIRAALRSQVGDNEDDDGTPLHFGEVPESVFQALESRLAGDAANGQPIADIFGVLPDDVANQAANALLNGLSQGPLAIASQLAQILQMSQNHAETIARNELIGSYRDAQLANYRANNDVVGQWIWNAAVASACVACIDMNGSVHSLDEDLIDHVMGRCEPLPVTKSWDDILSPYGISADGIPETSIADTFETGQDWFARQDEATQLSILGPAKYEAFSQGDITLDDLLGTHSDAEWGDAIYEKSLKELGLDAQDYLPSRASRDLASEVAPAEEAATAEAATETANIAEQDAGWQNIDDVLAGLRGEATGAGTVEEAAGPFGTVDDILARQNEIEKLYDIPVGDPTALEKLEPEVAARGVAEMEQMMSKLGNELRDNGAFMRLARYFGYSKDQTDAWMVTWGNAVRAAQSDSRILDEEDQALAAMTREEARTWADQRAMNDAIYSMLDQYHSAAASAVGDITKWNGNNWQIAILEAARQEFGMSNLAHDYYDAEQLAAAKEEFGTYRNGIRAFLRQMHTDTQQYFEENGISEITLFRGLRWNEGDQPAAVDWGGGLTENAIAAQPLASWASNAQVAYDYATGTGMSFFANEPAAYSMLLATQVPVDQVLSIGLTGLGATPLRETMLLAGDYPVYALPFEPGADMNLDAILQQIAEGGQ